MRGHVQVGVLTHNCPWHLVDKIWRNYHRFIDPATKGGGGVGWLEFSLPSLWKEGEISICKERQRIGRVGQFVSFALKPPNIRECFSIN